MQVLVVESVEEDYLCEGYLYGGLSVEDGVVWFQVGCFVVLSGEIVIVECVDDEYLVCEGEDVDEGIVDYNVCNEFYCEEFF